MKDVPSAPARRRYSPSDVDERYTSYPESDGSPTAVQLNSIRPIPESARKPEGEGNPDVVTDTEALARLVFPEPSKATTLYEYVVRLFRPGSRYSRSSRDSVSNATEPPVPSERSTTYPERPERPAPPASVSGALHRTTTSPGRSDDTADTECGASGARSSDNDVAPTKPDSSLRRPMVSTAATR